MTSSARCSSIAASRAPSSSAHSLNLPSMNAGRYCLTSLASTASICPGSAWTNAHANAEVVLEVRGGARRVRRRVVEDDLGAVAREEALEVAEQLGHAARSVL